MYETAKPEKDKTQHIARLETDLRGKPDYEGGIQGAYLEMPRHHNLGVP